MRLRMNYVVGQFDMFLLCFYHVQYFSFLNDQPPPKSDQGIEYRVACLYNEQVRYYWLDRVI